MQFFKNKERVRELNSCLSELSAKVADLEKQRTTIRAIIASMVEGVVAVDKDTKILSVNPSIERMFGISAKEAEGKFFLEVIRNNDIAEVIDEALKKAEFISRELALVWPVHKVFQVNASSIFQDNVAGGCVLVIHDITEMRKLEVMRRDFVANVSHELKTPLTSIKGFVETLLGGALDDKENSRDFLKIIQEHADRLDSLISDLLDLSHLESKEIKLEIKKIDLKDLADEILSGFKSQLRKKNIEAKNEMPAGVFVNADINKIRQIFTNLVDNAIKFNKEKGSIKIYQQESDGKHKIIVEDSGIGIPAKDISRIFERFYRVDKARSRELGGTGLGLSIVKHIVDLHGGTVGVESTEGLGSKFWFTLPK
jgi:two-component system phosphate regulon sensor histidine kinase PhoR